MRPPKSVTVPGMMVAVGLMVSAVLPSGAQETNGFELPLVEGEPTPLPRWSGFSRVVLQYGVGEVQDERAGAGLQALRLAPGNGIPGAAVTWSPQGPADGGAPVVTSVLVRHDLLATADPVIPTGEWTAVVFMNADGLHVLDGDGAGGGEWQLLHPLTEGLFHRITLIRNPATRTFRVALDDEMLAGTFGFKDELGDNQSSVTFESSGEVWLDEVSTDYEADRTPPSPDPLTWDTVPTPGAPGEGLELALATDFTNRLVSGNTARNLTWTTNGLAEPGDLTVVEVNGLGRLAGFFTSPAAIDRLIPNLNIGNEGPWRISLPLVPSDPPFLLKEVEMGIQHLGNAGTIPIINKRGKLTVSVTGSVSGLLGQVPLTHLVAANDGATRDFFVFDPEITLTGGEDYTLTILAEGNGDGANVGLEDLTIRRRQSGLTGTDQIVHMVATSAEDPSGVEYEFECLSGGGHDSGWQASPEFVDIGLSPGTRYTYRTRARDLSEAGNPTAWSAPATATTTGDPPAGSFAEWAIVQGLAPNDRDFGDDPDGDRLDNGLEAWFGTHPGEPDYWQASVSREGLATSFTHPRRDPALTDLRATYQWSTDLATWYQGDGVDGPEGGLTLTIFAAPVGEDTRVTAVASEVPEQLYLRVVVTLD